MKINLAEEISKAIHSLTTWPGVTRIWLFGSSVNGRGLDWRSDLDFAIEGLLVTDYASAWSQLDQVISLPVDLVRIETAPAVLKQQILTHGKPIYATHS
jgi:predicted nucleotidyltransferase